MTAPTLLIPDRRFVERIVASGGRGVKQCYQCATCSVTCELSNGDAPFPRKEMVWAQWGLRDRLVTDPDVWLCHQCNDCSVRCPRGARPGDVLAAVREQTVRHWAVPRFLAAWVNDLRLLPVMLLATSGLLGAALLTRDPVDRALGITEHHGLYAAFVPHWLLNTFFPFFTILSFVLLLVGLARFWRGMQHSRAGLSPVRGLPASAVHAVRAILLHQRFGKCGAQESRRWTHLAAFYGFLALFVVTIWAVVDIYVNPALGVDSRYPFDLLHPMKVLANVGGVLLVYGSLKAILDRRRDAPETGTSTAFDWVFVWLLFGVGVTGFATEVFRFTVDPESTGVAVTAAYAVYFVHLVLVFQLLVYLPYSKFAHIFYRTAAMIHAQRTGRDNGAHALGSGTRAAFADRAPPAAIAAGGP